MCSAPSAERIAGGEKSGLRLFWSNWCRNQPSATIIFWKLLTYVGLKQYMLHSCSISSLHWLSPVAYSRYWCDDYAPSNAMHAYMHGRPVDPSPTQNNVDTFCSPGFTETGKCPQQS